MSLVRRLLLCGALLFSSCLSEQPPSLDGIHNFANRLFDGQADSFFFELTGDHKLWSRWNQPVNDNYTVFEDGSGKIRVQGTTVNALARGLRHYANDILQLDEFWFLDRPQVPKPLPRPKLTLTGASVVPWRYNLNTVTFSYTFAWYTWDEWEKLLDWAAWRGINLQLAWVGYEKIFLDSFRDLGMTTDEILAFFSGPAFQAWNRFGNIKGSWGGMGNLTVSWIESQFSMQKKIIARMVELGITPVLPAFPGFVPDAITRIRPNASVTRAPNWLRVDGYSQDYFLDPLDSTYAELQHLFVSKQIKAFGNITSFYTLDQFNEMTPGSSNTDYIRNVSRATYRGLTAANPSAVWLMQGWLFYSSSGFWTQQTIDAYLDGIGEKSNALILDLYSENYPQWQRTKSFSSRPWIWCQLHNFGGNMNLFGQISNITKGPISALAESDTLVGFGLTPEGYEGNEVVYDILLDQAWSASPIDTKDYFRKWTTLRYGAIKALPNSLFKAWDILRQYIYDSTNPDIPSTGVGVYQLQPNLRGLVNRTGHWPAPTALHYDPDMLKKVLGLMLQAVADKPSLGNAAAFQLDLVDVTRQVMTNAFDDMYLDLISTYNRSVMSNNTAGSSRGPALIAKKGKRLLDFLDALDFVLSTQEHFTFDKWLYSARDLAQSPQEADLNTFNARSQVTVWNWDAPFLNDYSARAWSGLIKSYYYQRWAIFIKGLEDALRNGVLDEKALNQKIRMFERDWQYMGSTDSRQAKSTALSSLQQVIKQWPDVFKMIV